MKNVIELLNKNEKISAWRIAQKAVRSHELFFVHSKLETVRVRDTEDTSVTVYSMHDGKMGDSTFNVYRSMTDSDIEKKIALAAKRAELVFNEPYTLPEAGKREEVIASNIGDYKPEELGQMIADAVFAADDLDGGSINALEIFIYREESLVKNSNGVDKKQTKYRVMVEAIPTFTKGSDSVEVYEIYNFTDFDKDTVTGEIRTRMREVKDRFEAKKPETPLKVNVLLRPYEIASLFEELAYDVNYASVYAHANLHSAGENLQEGGNGDKLNLTLRSVVKGCPNSSVFDADGTDLVDTKILDNGVIGGYFGARRFGEYLKVERPSGNLACMELAAGTMGDDYLGEPYLDCAFMSALQVDLYNDYIGGEIRLAYYFDGKTVRPVTGITMSAKLSEVLKDIRLTEKVGNFGTEGYHGPEKILLKNVDVL